MCSKGCARGLVVIHQDRRFLEKCFVDELVMLCLEKNLGSETRDSARRTGREHRLHCLPERLENFKNRRQCGGSERAWSEIGSKTPEFKSLASFVPASVSCAKIAVTTIGRDAVCTISLPASCAHTWRGSPSCNLDA